MISPLLKFTYHPQETRLSLSLSEKISQIPSVVVTMNSSQKSPSPSSFSSYQFDFGFGSGSSTRNNALKPLKDQKPNPTASASAPRAPLTTPSWAPQPKKSSWTVQSAPATSNLAGPTSMVGDIFGKSWASTDPTSSSFGIVKSNPNLFGDLVGSALNQGKSSDKNVPLKAVPARNSYSMGNLADSLPKSNDYGGNSGSSMRPSWGSADNFAKIGSNSGNSMKSNGGSAAMFGNSSSSKPIGGQPMKSMSGVGSNPKGDPFVSLLNFGSKNSGNAPINSSQMKNSGIDSSFGASQNLKSSDFGMPAQKPMKTEDYSFGDFKNAEKNNYFGIPLQPETNQRPSAPLDSLFSSLKNSSGISASQQFGEMNDWDVGSEFGGQDHNETTTELEGLPPPPSGVTSLMAKSKGMDNYKQGQYADAIKWLSWAVVLIEKNGDSSEGDEVLVCRASCYKEVGEYKKAVADCSKVLEHDSTNVSVLLQRALLYESTEKYKLGADDLRMVLKIDPGNRLAKSTIHRLNKMAG